MGHPTKYLTSTIQNCPDYQNKETEKLSQPRGAKGDRTAKCSMGSWMPFWNRQRAHSKN